MHIAAIKPKYIAPEDVEASFLDKEKEIAKAQLAQQGKPENMIDKIVEGKMKKIYNDVCLLKQAFVKDDKKTVEEIIQELSAKTGEKVQVKRFSRFSIGE